MTARRPEIPALTGLRFVAAMGVVLFHLRGHISALLPGLAPLDTALSVGSLGVELFFVLSGFILGYHYLDSLARPTLAGYRRFLRQRLARIYPLHAATLAVLVLFVGAMSAAGRTVSNPEAYSGRSLLANLALTNCWTVRDCGLSWNGPAWSLSAEWLAYLAFPAAALLATVLRRGAALWIAVAAVTAAQLISTEMLGFEGGAPRVATTFLLGVLLARAHHDGLPGLPWGRIATLAGVGALGLAVLLAHLGQQATAVIPLFGVLVLALANAAGEGLGGRLQGPRLRFWGSASYGLYLTHAVVLAIGAEFIRLEVAATLTLPVRVLILFGYLLVMLVVAAAAYREVEQPWRLRLRAPVSAQRPVHPDLPQEVARAAAQ